MAGQAEVQAAPALVRVDLAPERSVVQELGSFARRNPMAVVGGLVGLLVILMAIAAPLIAPADPLKTDFRRMAKPPDTRVCSGPIRSVATL